MGFTRAEQGICKDSPKKTQTHSSLYMVYEAGMSILCMLRLSEKLYGKSALLG